MKRLHLNQRGAHHVIVPLIAFILLFGVTGTYLYVRSEAAAQPELRSGLTVAGGPYCLDDHSDGGENSVVDAWACNGTPAQDYSYNTSDSEIMVGKGCLVTQGAPAAVSFTQDPVVISTQCGTSQAVPWGGAWTEIGNSLEGYVFENNHADSKANNGTWCLDIKGAKAEAPVEIYQCNQGSGQLWIPDTYTPSTSSGSWSGELQLGSDTSLCLDNLSSNPNPNATIDAYTCNVTAAQKWTINELSGRTDRFTLEDGQGTCADNTSTVYNGTTYYVGTNADNRVYVKSSGCNTTNNYDLWEWEGHQLENIGSAGCLNDPAGADDPGTAQIVYSCSGDPSDSDWYEAAQAAASSGTAECTDENGQVVGGNSCSFWEGSNQNDNGNFTATGVSADIGQANPTVTEGVDPTNKAILSQTELELWSASANNQQVIEIGWVKSAHTSNAVLLVTAWLNGALLGYVTPSNKIGFVETGSSMEPGDTVAPGITAQYKLQYSNNEWQVFYNGTEIGYFPESIWSSKGVSFTDIQDENVYGEVDNGYLSQPATIQMGNGKLGTTSSSTAISNYTLYGSSTPANLNAYYESQGAAASKYDYGNATATGFSVGGPGF